MPAKPSKPKAVKPPKGPRSNLEVALQAQMRACGLPEPLWQHRFAKETLDRNWEFDGCWYLPEAAVAQYGEWHLTGIAFEVEGGITPFRDKRTGELRQGGHSTVGGYEENCIKYAQAALLGWVVVRVTRRMIDDGRAITLIESALRLFGVLPPAERFAA